MKDSSDQAPTDSQLLHSIQKAKTKGITFSGWSKQNKGLPSSIHKAVWLAYPHGLPIHTKEKTLYVMGEQTVQTCGPKDAFKRVKL